jgi:crotonobetainyl-CoA:carnitine CoA-transferase CaiB-like acyl-CoA transferase
MLISIQSDREWEKFCAAFLARPELAADARFARNVARVRNRAETDAIVAAAFAAFDEAEAREALLGADTAFAAVNDMAALSAHPHLRRIAVETEVGPVCVPAPAPIVMGQPRDYGCVPAIGAHGAHRDRRAEAGYEHVSARSCRLSDGRQ